MNHDFCAIEVDATVLLTMKYAVLGTGTVGITLANKLLSQGHAVTLGSRSRDNAKAVAWKNDNAAAGDRARIGTFADAAAFGEVVINCTLGAATIEALALAGESNLAGKVVIDTSNPLDFSKGMPPSLFTNSEDSLGERVQRTFASAKIVKALNTMAAPLMVDPQQLAGGEHDVFLCGNDAEAKQSVTTLLRSFGWKHVVDLGDITASRATEHYLPLWLRLWGATGTHLFSVHVVRG
jgi:predicted dinucleotide-binding enzyme